MRKSTRPLPNPLDGLLGYQLRRASVSVVADLAQRLAPLGLSAVTASILLLINDNPGVTQSELARQLSVKRANMAPLMAELIERGLVARMPADGRSHALSLTEAGRAAATHALARISAHELDLARRLDGADALQFAQTLKKLWASP